MYAVIRTGGKQYKVKAGDVLRVEKLEKQLGDEFQVEDVLFLSGKTSHIGEPLVSDAKVTVVVTEQGKAKKIIVFKKKRRQGYRRLNGHRQPYTELFIKEILGPGGEKETTSSQAKIKNPEEKAARLAAKSEAKKSAKTDGKKPAPKKKAAAKKKTAAKKTTTKKKATKKAASKKTTKKKA